MAVLFVASGCRDAATPTPEPEPEAYSLSGEALHPPTLPEDVQRDREEKLAVARAEYEAHPDDPDALIWLGRRTAYLGRYREAIEIFTDGIERFPDDARMYRHRGHRYISTRQLDQAIVDLERAAALIAGKPDEVEPDGLPNARNIPTSTLQSNIWYHLGLAYYLQDDLDNALRTYRECLKVSKNPDMLCATSHWLWMTLRRLDRDAEAAALLEPIHADLDVIENEGYHRLLLMYKGELSPDDLLSGDGDAIQSATVGYGVANWHREQGRADEARATLDRVLASGQWAAFGYLAAEADLVRMGA